MTKKKKEEYRKLIKENGLKSTKDIQEMLKDMFGGIIKEMLEGEMEEELGYSRYDYKNKETDNSRNGYNKKKVRSDYGDLELSVPRDRKGEFDPVIVKKGQRDISGIEEQIISMYARGMTVRDIRDHIQNIYGTELSAESVSRITDRVLPLVSDWRNRPLEDAYAIIYMDAIFYKVKDNGQVKKKALYIALGINMEGFKDVLGMWICETEGASYWLDVLNELNNRGVKDVAIFSIDGLTGLEEAIGNVFPHSEIQRCVVHQIRYSLKYVGWKDRRIISKEFKSVYQAPTEEAGWNALLSIEEKWSAKYPLTIKSWKENWASLSTFYQYPQELRKIVYTTNPIESLNRQLRKVTKNKGVFPNDTALFKMAYLAIKNVTEKWTVRTLGWGKILGQLVIKYDRLSEFID